MSIDPFHKKLNFSLLNIRSINCGGRNIPIVLTSENKIYSWGNNKKGQLIIDDKNKQNTPCEIKLNNIKSINCRMVSHRCDDILFGKSERGLVPKDMTTSNLFYMFGEIIFLVNRIQR